MAIQPYVPQPVIVEISDRIPGVLKQKVKVVGYCYLDASKTESGPNLIVNLEVSLYSSVTSLYGNASGTYGPEQAGAGLNVYPEQLVANNLCALDPLTKQIRHIAPEGETLEAFRARLAAMPEVYELQGDWVENMMNHEASFVGPMLTSFILQADQPPFSKFTRPLV